MRYRKLQIISLVALVAVASSRLWADPPELLNHVEIQRIQVRNDDGSNASTVVTYESETDKIWAQAGIDIRFVGGTNTYDSTAHNVIDNNAELSAMVNGAGHGQNSDPTVLNQFYVDQLYPGDPGTTYGVAYVDANGAAYDGSAIQAFGSAGRLDTVAHETGHNLGLGHTNFGAGGAKNLMTSGSSRSVPGSISDIYPDGAELDQLTAEQLKEVHNSDFVKGDLQHLNLAEKTVTSGVTTYDMASDLVGDGVSIQNIHYYGAANASGTFEGGAGRVDGFDAGVFLTTGSAENAYGPNESDSISTNNGLDGADSLNQFAGGTTYDASILTFDFIPTGNVLEFNYVFASDEYNEFANSSFNDVFGLFVNGSNQAVIPGTTEAVSINNVNELDNSEYYVNNSPWEGTIDSDSLRDIEYDGMTTVLPLQATLNPGEVNTMEVAIADTGDHIYDSAVFLEKGTFSSVTDPDSPPGATPQDPIMPDPEEPQGGGFGFTFEPLDGFTFIDPIVAVGYDYEVLSGPDFTEVVLPSLPFDSTYDLWYEGSGGLEFLSSIAAGSPFSFLDVLGTEVSFFRVVGIDIQNMLDPSDPLAFPTGLKFASLDEVEMSMTPLTANTVIPEASSSVIWLGLGAIGLFLRRFWGKKRQ